MTRKASLDFLAARRLGRLACSNGSQPYVTPFYFAYHDQWIYGFSTVGRRIEWLRTNPLVCVQVDEITSPQEWTSIVVLGRYEELRQDPDGEADRELAHSLLQQNRAWWEPGYANTFLKGKPRPLEPVYFRLSIDEITGHQAVPT